MNTLDRVVLTFIQMIFFFFLRRQNRLWAKIVQGYLNENIIRIERTKIESRLVNILTCYSKKSNLTNCQEKKAKLDDSFAQKRSKISETLRVLWIYSFFFFFFYVSNRTDQFLMWNATLRIRGSPTADHASNTFKNTINNTFRSFLRRSKSYNRE